MIQNRISGICESSEKSALNRNQRRWFQRSPGNRSIFNRGFFPSGSNRHLDVGPTHGCCESCYFNSLHLAFILPPLNHEWFDIHRQPITAQDSRWSSTFYQFPNFLLPSTRPSPALMIARAMLSIFKRFLLFFSLNDSFTFLSYCNESSGRTQNFHFNRWKSKKKCLTRF